VQVQQERQQQEATLQQQQLQQQEPAAQQQQEQQQQKQQQREQREQQQREQQQLVHEAGLLAASMAGLSSPDMSFATAAVAAAAAAAAAEQLLQQQAATAAAAATTVSSSSSSSNTAAGNGYGSLPPGYVTLQAHAVLHCLTDLQRLAVRRQWRGSGNTARLTSISSNVYGGSYNGYNTTTSHVTPTAAPAEPPSLGAAAPGFPRRGVGLTQPLQGSAGARPGAARVQGGRVGEGSGGSGLSGRQLVVQCQGKQAWQLAGVLVAAWLHWCGGVDQAAAEDGVSKAMGITIDQVSVPGADRSFGAGPCSWPIRHD
jgi:hypothetical protein